MSALNIKPTHKPIKTYYAELKKYAQLGEENEGTVRAAFQNLLQHYCHQSDFTLLCEKTRAVSDTGIQGEYRRIRPDGEVIYRVKTDERSGIVNDPNRVDDPQYIVRLIGKVITGSLETVDIVNALPALDIR